MRSFKSIGRKIRAPTLRRKRRKGKNSDSNDKQRFFGRSLRRFNKTETEEDDVDVKAEEHVSNVECWEEYSGIVNQLPIFSLRSQVVEEKGSEPSKSFSVSAGVELTGGGVVVVSDMEHNTIITECVTLDKHNELKETELSHNRDVLSLARYLPRIVINNCTEQVFLELWENVKLTWEALDQLKEGFFASWGKDDHTFWENFKAEYDIYVDFGSQDLLQKNYHVLEHSALLMADVSGFTRLNERFAEEGRPGIEKVSLHLNGYLNQMLRVIEDHGGDCIKFAGDALIVLFHKTLPSEESEPDEMTIALRAAQCALALQHEVGTVSPIEGVTLSMHIGVSYGRMYGLYVGGIQSEWEFLLAGLPFSDIEAAVDASNHNEVVVSKSLWRIIESVSTGFELEDIPGYFRLENILNGTDVIPLPPLNPPDEITQVVRAYVPACVLQQHDSGESLDWIAEHRLASVVFVNLRGLVLNQDNFDQKSLQLVHQTLKSLQIILNRNRGYRRQFLVDDKGSTFIAVFGVPPFVHENDAFQAIKASIEFSKVLSICEVDHSIGVATGNVYVGSVGSTRREHAVVGDTVNTAARLSGKAKVGQILCDKYTVEKAGDLSFQWRPQGQIKVKGKNILLEVAEPVLAEGGHMFESRLFFGRERICSDFMELTLEINEFKESQVVFIQSDPGMGKTHLMYRLHSLSTASGYCTAFVSCQTSEMSKYFYVLKRSVAQILGIDDMLSGIVSRSRVIRALERVLPLFIAGDAASLYQLLWADDSHRHGYFGRDSDEEDIRKSRELRRPLMLRARLSPLIIHIFKEKVKELGVVILFFDDIHFADVWSLNIIQQLLIQVNGLVICCGSRVFAKKSGDKNPQMRALITLSKFHNVKHIKLKPLGHTYIAQLLQQMLAVEQEIPEFLTQELLKKSKGNPLYAIECAYALRDSGIIRIRDGLVTIEGDLDLEELIPHSMRKIMMRRYDSLQPKLQLLCKIASLFGTEFFGDEIEFIFIRECKSEKADLLDLLSDLRNLDLIEILPHNRYRFKNQDFQQCCYDMILFSKKEELHLLLGSWIDTCLEIIAEESVVIYDLYLRSGWHYFCAAEIGNEQMHVLIKALHYVRYQVQNGLESKQSNVTLLIKKALEMIEKVESITKLPVYLIGMRVEMMESMIIVNESKAVSVVFGSREHEQILKDMEWSCKVALQYVKDLSWPLLLKYSAAILEIWKLTLHSGNFLIAKEYLDFFDTIEFDSGEDRVSEVLLITFIYEIKRSKLWFHVTLGNFKEALRIYEKEIFFNSLFEDSEYWMSPLPIVDSQMIAALCYWIVGDIHGYLKCIQSCFETTECLNHEEQAMQCWTHVLIWIFPISLITRNTDLLDRVCKSISALLPMFSSQISQYFSNLAFGIHTFKDRPTELLHLLQNQANHRGEIWASMLQCIAKYGNIDVQIRLSEQYEGLFPLCHRLTYEMRENMTKSSAKRELFDMLYEDGSYGLCVCLWAALLQEHADKRVANDFYPRLKQVVSDQVLEYYQQKIAT